MQTSAQVIPWITEWETSSAYNARWALLDDETKARVLQTLHTLETDSGSSVLDLRRHRAADLDIYSVRIDGDLRLAFRRFKRDNQVVALLLRIAEDRVLEDETWDDVR